MSHWNEGVRKGTLHLSEKAKLSTGAPLGHPAVVAAYVMPVARVTRVFIARNLESGEVGVILTGPVDADHAET